LHGWELCKANTEMHFACGFQTSARISNKSCTGSKQKCYEVMRMKMSASLVIGNPNMGDTKGLKLAVVKLMTSLSFCCSNSHLFVTALCLDREGLVWTLMLKHNAKFGWNVSLWCESALARRSGDIINCEDFMCADGQRTGHTCAHHQS